MSLLSKIRATEYGSEYGSNLMKNYSEPKIYHGGESFDLSKRWYVYYSYRDPKTGKLKRMPPIYNNVNSLYQNKKGRLVFLERLRILASEQLANGFNPYRIVSNTKRAVEDELDFAITQKEKLVKDTTYRDYVNRTGHFKKYLDKKGMLRTSIKEIKRKHVNDFLNEVLEKSGARNRNNTRMVLSSLFSVLEENDIIEVNFVKSIKPLKTTPTRNKTYSLKEAEEIFEWIQKTNSHLLLYIKFISYAFLRPIEACRLKVGDINFIDKTLTVRAKNKALKTKVIPDLLLKELEVLKDHKPKEWIFAPDGIGQSDTTEINRRDYYSKQFLKVKKKFSLGVDYSVYSFRHTFVTKVYRELRKSASPFEAKSKLMLITGHSTMTALEKYLRDIDAELPEDYSNLLS